MSELFNDEFGVYITSKFDVPYLRLFKSTFDEVLFDQFDVNYGATVLVVGSFYGALERRLFYRGAKTIVTYEPYERHVQKMMLSRKHHNFKTPMQTWHIVSDCVHNTFDFDCLKLGCEDYLHIPESSSAFASVESREAYTAITNQKVIKRRLPDVFNYWASMEVIFTHVIMDFDGALVVLGDYANPLILSSKKVLCYVSPKEMKRPMRRVHEKAAITKYTNNEASIRKYKNFFLINS